MFGQSKSNPTLLNSFKILKTIWVPAQKKIGLFLKNWSWFTVAKAVEY